MLTSEGKAGFAVLPACTMRVRVAAVQAWQLSAFDKVKAFVEPDLPNTDQLRLAMRERESRNYELRN
jgi:hypothetical protein